MRECAINLEDFITNSCVGEALLPFSSFLSKYIKDTLRLLLEPFHKYREERNTGYTDIRIWH